MMKKIYRSLLYASVIFLLLNALPTFAQQVVTGKITDATNQGMPGVNVIKKGTTIGTTTNGDGVFSIEASSSDILQISFIGYKTAEVAVANQTKINVVLEEDVETLQEVVVTGYGELRKSDLTSAQTSISAKAIERTVNTTFEQAIQGRSAGVYVTQNTGAPGGGVSVNIRGINTLSGSNEPLYVIDGIQILGSTSASGVNPLSALNPADILSFEILQGPSATALYGSRATNGVVLITTKRGKAGDIKISYGLTYNVQAAPKGLDVMNLQQYARMDNEYKAIAGGEVREDFLDPSILGQGTNWQNELFNPAALMKHQISLSGGSEKAAFYLSGERTNQDGIAVASEFKRTSIRLNLDIKPRDWFEIGTNLNFVQTNDKLGANNLNENNLIVNAIQLGPQIPVKNLDGSYGGGDPNINAEQFAPPNPIAIGELSTNDLEKRTFLGGVNATFKIIDGLKFQTNFNTNAGFSNSTYFFPTYDFGWQENSNAYLENNHNYSWWWSWNQMLQYSKQLGDHHIDVMATHEAQESYWKNLRASRSGFLTNDVLDINAGDASTAGNYGGQGYWAQESYLGRINYNFGNRYIVQAAIRADGSAYFGPENKWGVFPSISGVWRLSEEKFFNVPSVSDLRFRYETGVTGQPGYNGNAIYGVFAAALPTEWGSGFRPASYPNPELKWEETKTNNFGITLGLLDSRIQLDADYYIKNTENLILSMEYPWYMGTSGAGAPSAPTVNIGTLENRGWGFSLNTVNINRNGFKWESNLNVSGFKTKIKSLAGTANHITVEGQDWFLSNFAQRTQVGYSAWQFFGYKEEGIFKSIEEIENSALPVDNQGNEWGIHPDSIWVGDVKYKDVSGDGIITADDRTFLGSPYPKFFGGFTNTFSFKGFDISILLTYSYGNKVYNYLRYVNNNPNNINLGRNMFVEALDYAKVAEDEEGNPYLLNPGTEINRISASSLNGNYDRLTDKYLEDGSYLRVKNISVNYNIPSSLVTKMKVIKSMRVGVTMQNVFTITGYTGYDPEIGSYVGPNAGVAQKFTGVDYGRYPLTPQYGFNLTVEF